MRGIVKSFPGVKALRGVDLELHAGDVIAYDEGVHFLNDLFNHDFGPRVEFVSSRLTPAQYIARLRALRAKWVGVTRGTAAEQALVEAGGEFLFQTPDSPMAMYRLGPARP